jgi:RNA polymerase sigma-70 factor, ECF subfamily
VRAFDEAYLQALAERDPRTEDELIHTFSRAIKTKLRTHLRSPQAIEDAYQETLLRVFTYFRLGKRLRTPASLPAFVHSVSSHVALEMVRTHRRINCSCDDLPELVDTRSNPEGDSIANERRDTVRRILGELSTLDQQLLRRVCLDEEDRDQICRELRVTRDYLRLLLYRARLRFKALVQSGSQNHSMGTMRIRDALLSPCPVKYPYSGSRNSASDASRRALPLRGAFAG